MLLLYRKFELSKLQIKNNHNSNLLSVKNGSNFRVKIVTKWSKFWHISSMINAFFSRKIKFTVLIKAWSHTCNIPARLYSVLNVQIKNSFVVLVPFKKIQCLFWKHKYKLNMMHPIRCNVKESSTSANSTKQNKFNCYSNRIKNWEILISPAIIFSHLNFLLITIRQHTCSAHPFKINDEKKIN